MAKVTGFLEFHRQKPSKRPVAERLKDWKEYELPFPDETLRDQAARCMDCGIPFCHGGCPLGNVIPDFNDLVYHGNWAAALERLHATNNFPEFTGSICPAPCENSCVLAMDQYQEAVTIKKVELAIIDKGWAEGWIVPQVPAVETGKRVAVVGSGPAGLAAAQQLRRAGHGVTVYERADRIGGLLRYGIPHFKMEKWRLDKRVEQMEAEGVKFVVNANAGVNPTAAELKAFDAVVLCGGSTQARDLGAPGRELKGVHFAMEFLTQSNKVQEGDAVAGQISAQGRHVVVIGGGDTGADCIGTSHRQGAKAVTSLEIVPQPPDSRPADNPWPQWARVFRTAGAHEEGGDRLYAISTRRFVGEHGVLKGIETVQVKWEGGKPVEVPGSEKILPADLVFLAMGFTGPEKGPLLDGLGVELDARGNVKSDPATKMTSVKGVFTAGDMTRGQSLVVWAISEGRKAAQQVDKYLMGSTTLAAAPLVSKNGSKSPLMVVFTTVFMDLVGFGMIIPLLALYGKDLGAGGWTLGLLGASYSLAQFAFAPLWGQVSDRYGRRPMLLMSLAGASLSYFGFAGATALRSLAFLFVTRFFQGAFSANISAAQAYIADVTTPERRAGGMALVGIAFGIGFIVGPPLGGISMAHFGLLAPGLIAGTICGLNFLLAWVRLPESLPLEIRQRNRAQPFRGYDPLNVDQLKRAWRHPVMGLLLAVSFLQITSFSMMEQVFSLFFKQRFHFSLAMAGERTGILLCYVGVVAGLVQGGYVRRAKRFNESRALSIGLALFSATLFFLPFGPSYASYFLLLLPLSVGRSLIDPSTSSLVSKASNAAEQGRAFGTFQGLNSLARVLGPLVGLTLFESNPNLPFQLGGLICVVVLGLSLVLAGRFKTMASATAV